MATRIIEYDVTDATFPVIPSASLVEQSPLTSTGTTQQSAAFNVLTNMVCVQSDEQVYVRVGDNPTATASSYRLNAGGENFWRVERGTGQKVAIK